MYYWPDVYFLYNDEVTGVDPSVSLYQDEMAGVDLPYPCIFVCDLCRPLCIYYHEEVTGVNPSVSFF